MGLFFLARYSEQIILVKDNTNFIKREQERVRLENERKANGTFFKDSLCPRDRF